MTIFLAFRLRIAVMAASLAVIAAPAAADTVVPSSDVTTRVIVRESASAQSAAIGSLRPGEELELVGSVPNWHEVRLSGSLTGFVSKRWTRAMPTTVGPVTPAVVVPTFTMDVIDVGTGLAVLVRRPDFILIYDGGSNDDTALGTNNRLLAFLKTVSADTTWIDHVILSHPHRDHVELLPDVFAAYQVRQVWDSGRINDICGYRAFLTSVREEQGVVYHNALQAFGTLGYPFAPKRCYG
jgi:competence protein ComEC